VANVTFLSGCIAPWATAMRSAREGSRVVLPQTIAHRGYKAAWPENTMGAFKGAVQVGAHAIETDLQLTADGVVVISHVGISRIL
jgi:phosphatidylglycerol phospholipase C